MSKLVVQILDSHEQQLNLFIDFVRIFEELADGKEDKISLMLAKGQLDIIRTTALRFIASTIVSRNEFR